MDICERKADIGLLADVRSGNVVPLPNYTIYVNIHVTLVTYVA